MNLHRPRSRSCRLAHRWLALLAFEMTFAGCSERASDGTSPAGGAGAGSGGGTLIAGATGSGGAAGQGDAAGEGGAFSVGGASGAAAGQGGGAGSPAVVDEFSNVWPGLSGFDLEGFGEDLPAPEGSDQCLQTLTTNCMKVGGEYNGEAFECEGANVVYWYPDQSRNVSCAQAQADGDELGVSILLGAPVFRVLPSAFDIRFTPDTDTRSLLAFANVTTRFGTNDELMFGLASTHRFEGRLVGEAWLGSPRSERARGVFAATLEPLPSCVPDAEGNGCDSVRWRGVFSAWTVNNSVAIAQAGESCIDPPGMGRCASGLVCLVPAGEETGTCTAP